MQLVFSSVSSALGDPQSLLSKAIGTAFKVGVGVPARFLQAGATAGERPDVDQEEEAKRA